MFGFTTQAPVVTNPTMYVFYANLDGVTLSKGGDPIAIGSIAETIVQVVP